MAVQKPTPELTQEICNNVRIGMLPHAAARLAGVGRAEFRDWMHKATKGQEPFLALADEIEKASLATQRHVIGNVTAAATKDPKIGMQFLAMRYPEHFSEHGRERAVQLEVESRSIQEIKTLAEKMASRFPLLHWEKRDEFEALLANLLAEHAPQGPTEEHLVEELAGVIQTRTRLRLAEAAAHRRRLQGILDHKSTVEAALVHVGETDPTETVSDALAATDEDTVASLAIIEKEETIFGRVIEILESSKKGRFEAAKEALGPYQEWWTNALARSSRDYKKEQLYTDTPEDLRRYMDELLGWYPPRVQELESRPLIRQQAFGESFDAKSIEYLRRIESYLDRKFETTLGRLIQLRELRLAKAS